MSFSAKVKGEICRYTDISIEEALAEISAIMKGSGTIGFSGRGLSFKITTENPASARHIFTILKEYFDIHSKLMVKKSNSLKKNNIYMVLIDEEIMTDWLANLYVNTLNVIHYMHDKYSYESLQMALHDRDVFRTMACGIAGLSVCADSLSAIKYAKVKPIRNEEGIAVDFEVEGDFPKYGNDDDRVDEIAAWLVESKMCCIIRGAGASEG